MNKMRTGEQGGRNFRDFSTQQNVNASLISEDTPTFKWELDRTVSMHLTIFTCYFSFSVINSMTKNNLEKKGYSPFIKESQGGNSGKTLDAGTAAEIMEEFWLVAGSKARL